MPACIIRNIRNTVVYDYKQLKCQNNFKYIKMTLRGAEKFLTWRKKI